jgi:hypothetical protein
MTRKLIDGDQRQLVLWALDSALEAFVTKRAKRNLGALR